MNSSHEQQTAAGNEAITISSIFTNKTRTRSFCSVFIGSKKQQRKNHRHATDNRMTTRLQHWTFYLLLLHANHEAWHYYQSYFF